jgi:hypothetical protein
VGWPADALVAAEVVAVAAASTVPSEATMSLILDIVVLSLRKPAG